jgi:hypothetical protein
MFIFLCIIYVNVADLSSGSPFPDDKGVVLIDVATHFLKMRNEAVKKLYEHLTSLKSSYRLTQILKIFKNNFIILFTCIDRLNYVQNYNEL